MRPVPADFAFETDRLSVAVLGDPARPGLIRQAGAILTPQATAFLPPALRVAPGGPDAAAWLRRAARDATVLTVHEIGGGLAGFVLLHDGGAGEIMFGYLLAERLWGRGLGTELLAGLVSALRAAGCTAVLIGGVDPMNAASMRILRKTGFRRRFDRGPDRSFFFELDLAGP